MGFRTGSYAKIWEVIPKNDTCTAIRISTSHKDKQSGEYTQDFSGYVSVYGSAAAGKAAKLKKGDRIKLGDVDVTTTYDAVKKVSYTNFKCFSFEIQEQDGTVHGNSVRRTKEVDDGEVDEPSDLPF